MLHCQVIAAKGLWYVLYFLFVIFLGPFYLINLVLAVVSLSYEQETAALQDEDLRVSRADCKVHGVAYFKPVSLLILLHEKFLQFDWLRAVVFHTVWHILSPFLCLYYYMRNFCNLIG